MKPIPSPKQMTNGEIIGKMRSSSASSQNLASTVIIDSALHIHRNHPPTCPPASQTSQVDPQEGKAQTV